MTENTPTRRKLQFDQIDDALADVNTLAGGAEICSGKWTFGQILGHLAAWVDFSYEGAPLKIPFFVRWIARPLRNQMIYKPMRTGARIPFIKGGTLATNPLSTEDGLAQFRASFSRLQKENPTYIHPMLGKLTHDEWINLNLRHAELHLSFVCIK